MSSFQDFKLKRQLLEAVDSLGFREPTPVQEKAIPLIQAGHDVMGIAQTGTGKTAAFVLPLLAKLGYAQGQHPRALILAPTRELVLQISQDVAQLSQFQDIRYAVLYGGIGPQAQIQEVQAGVDLLVSTPGRFLDLYFREGIFARDIRTLVLDEADRMMDMGFMPQIRQILEVIPTKRQNLLFSATMPAPVIELSHEFLEYPEVVEVSPSATAAETVEQSAYALPNFLTKVRFLEYLLKDEAEYERVIVFARTRKNADNLFKFISRKFDPEHVRVIHANKGQNTRINSIKDFKSGLIRVLVATDVAARGIDVTMVSHVINFDVPIRYEEYVHRIGRTGRAHNLGKALTFFNPAESYHLHNIEQLIRKKINRYELPADLEIAETPFEEEQAMAREIDNQKKKEDPNYQGAFHDKKKKPGNSKGAKGGKDSKKRGGRPR